MASRIHAVTYLLNYRVTQLFHAIYSSASSLVHFHVMQICSFPLSYRYTTSPLSDSIARRVRHQIVWQTRRVVLQPINSAFRRTRSGARCKKVPIKVPVTFAARVYAGIP